MQTYTELIALLQGHAQRYFEIWNFQVVVAVAVTSYVMTREGLAANGRIRMNITIVFLLMAIFSVYTLSIHHNHETLLYTAIQSRIAVDDIPLTPAELQYIESLQPLSFLRKAAALVFVDLLVIGVTWLSPKARVNLNE